MPLFTTLAALSTVADNNPPDGVVDPPSTIDNQLRLLGSFIAQLRDAPFSFKNRLRNGNFKVNQHGVAGVVVLAAGAYGHDGWKAGAGGCTYNFAASGNDIVITITAGSLLQVVEAGLVEGGTYALSNQGTAQARIAVNGAATAGAYAAATGAAPLLSAGATPNQQVTVEFSVGTLDRVQLEPGAMATPFERRPPGIELAINQRYGRPWGQGARGIWISSTMVRLAGELAPMRAPPSASLITTTPTVENWQIASFTGSGSTLSVNNSSANFIDVSIAGFTGAPTTTPQSHAYPPGNIVFLSAEL